jgi:hypothetical protein
VAIVLIAFSTGFGIRGSLLFNQPNTLVSLSPDDQWRVALVERNQFIDRNFDLLLEYVNASRSRTVSRLPDEGRPIGSERIIWSADNSRFLLLGRHFYQADAARMKNGEQPYLMMDIPSGRIWCNASQQSEFPAFTIDDLKLISWVGWNPD